MRYLLDGYNLLFRYIKTKDPLEKKREQLVSLLSDLAGKLKIDLTLVFDGSTHASRGHFQNVEIVYTTDRQTADEYIEEEVVISCKPEKITVVTNDQQLKRRCHNLHSKTQSLEEFLHFLEKKKAKLSTLKQEMRCSEGELARLLRIFDKKLQDGC